MLPLVDRVRGGQRCVGQCSVMGAVRGGISVRSMHVPVPIPVPRSGSHGRAPANVCNANSGWRCQLAPSQMAPLPWTSDAPVYRATPNIVLSPRHLCAIRRLECVRFALRHA